MRTDLVGAPCGGIVGGGGVVMDEISLKFRKRPPRWILGLGEVAQGPCLGLAASILRPLTGSVRLPGG